MTLGATVAKLMWALAQARGEAAAALFDRPVERDLF